jgi:hypothetical protein
MKILHRNILILIIAVIESALVTIGLDIGGNNIGSIAFLFYCKYNWSRNNAAIHIYYKQKS